MVMALVGIDVVPEIIICYPLKRLRLAQADINAGHDATAVNGADHHTHRNYDFALRSYPALQTR